MMGFWRANWTHIVEDDTFATVSGGWNEETNVIWRIWIINIGSSHIYYTAFTALKRDERGEKDI